MALNMMNVANTNSSKSEGIIIMYDSTISLHVE